MGKTGPAGQPKTPRRERGRGSAHGARSHLTRHKDQVMHIRSKRSSFVKAALAAACAFGIALPAFAQGTQTLVIEPDQGLTSIYSLINAAKSTIDMTMYELQDTTAQNDLCNAVARGVKVRVILDVNREKSNNTSAYNQLSNCGVSVKWAWTTYSAT